MCGPDDVHDRHKTYKHISNDTNFVHPIYTSFHTMMSTTLAYSPAVITGDVACLQNVFDIITGWLFVYMISSYPTWCTGSCYGNIIIILTCKVYSRVGQFIINITGWKSKMM